MKDILGDDIYLGRVVNSSSNINGYLRNGNFGQEIISDEGGRDTLVISPVSFGSGFPPFDLGYLNFENTGVNDVTISWSNNSGLNEIVLKDQQNSSTIDVVKILLNPFDFDSFFNADIELDQYTGLGNWITSAIAGTHEGDQNGIMNDVIFSGSGADTIIGGAGNDFLSGGNLPAQANF